MKIENIIQEIATELYGKNIETCNATQLYESIMLCAKRMAEEKRTVQVGKRKVYYVSAEFLIGRLLSNNLLNLGVYDEVEEILRKHGRTMTEIEEQEPEPSLGNGGLGRLAACFLDSIATLGLNGDGIGLNYHLGLFKQVFADKQQKEEINPWIENKSWLKDGGISFEVPFKDFSLRSTLYNIDVVGYKGAVNQLRLFDVETIDETVVTEGITFDKTDIKRNLTLFLYPDDSDREGHLLRIYQQYFMVSNAAQLILKECKEAGYEISDLHKYAVIQINDTHPSMIIPELIRLLQTEGITFDDAANIVKQTCAYTNHTILAEALEKWPLEYLEEVTPYLVPIIQKLHEKVQSEYPDAQVQIIDESKRVHMAHLDIHYSFSVNGVAALHTDILKKEELKPFYNLYPEKFNNKTNGITFRRWLFHCNKELTQILDKKIGTDYKKEAMHLEEFYQYADDEQIIETILDMKYKKKRELKEYLAHTTGVQIDEISIFDIQIKRLHEYKRQQMNALYIIYKYLEIKGGNIPKTPITMIFGAKAAPAYTIAKNIIHLILCLQELIAADDEVNKHFKVIMVENYNVSAAEKLIPACDVSEQISLASKEASGTGNMKFMLNGAITLGTMDGANVEIHDLVGNENMYLFGESSETVIEHYRKGDYISKNYYENNPMIQKVVDFIVDEKLCNIGERSLLETVHGELINKDWFMTLLDLQDYITVKEQAFADYANRKSWAKKMIVNIAKAGFFSSDRTIMEYNRDIWKLG